MVFYALEIKSLKLGRDIDVIYKNRIRRIGMNVTYTVQVCIMKLEGL